MLLAALGDIHGNLPALEAVLEEIDEAGIQTVVNTGDCVAGHPWPNEVIDHLDARNILTVQGEMDRFVSRFLRNQGSLKKRCTPDQFEVLRWAHENTRSDNLEFLRALPRTRTLVVDGVAIFVCHGVGERQSRGLREDDKLDNFRRLRETAPAQLIISGRTHKPFARWVDDTLFVNPGAVDPDVTDAARACYATIDTEKDPWETHFHHL